MHAMVDRSRTPLGHSAPASLLELGYTRACAAAARPTHRTCTRTDDLAVYGHPPRDRDARAHPAPSFAAPRRAPRRRRHGSPLRSPPPPTLPPLSM